LWKVGARKDIDSKDSYVTDAEIGEVLAASAVSEILFFGSLKTEFLLSFDRECVRIGLKMECIDFVIELANFRVRSASPNDCVPPILGSGKVSSRAFRFRFRRSGLSSGALIDLRKRGKTNPAFAGLVSYVGSSSSARL
jgi:hypothetical protein